MIEPTLNDYKNFFRKIYPDEMKRIDKKEKELFIEMINDDPNISDEAKEILKSIMV